MAVQIKLHHTEGTQIDKHVCFRWKPWTSTSGYWYSGKKLLDDYDCKSVNRHTDTNSSTAKFFSLMFDFQYNLIVALIVICIVIIVW